MIPLGRFRAKELNITRSTTHGWVDVYEVDPSELLSFNRLDLASKIRFAEEYLDGNLSHDAVEEYLQTIDAFTRGRFTEPGDPDKDSPDKFVESFKHTIDSIADEGFDPSESVVPVSADFAICDGAHRLAACTAVGCTLQVAVVQPEGGLRWNNAFFKRKMIDEGLIEKFSLKLSMHFDDWGCLLIWPSVSKESKTEILSELNKRQGLSTFKYQFSFTRTGLIHLNLLCYRGDTWTSHPVLGYLPLRQRARRVRASGDVQTVYVIVLDVSQREVSELKTDLRESLVLPNESIHAPDTQHEAREFLKHLFNPHTRHLFNYGSILDSRLYDEIAKLEELDLMDGSFIVDSSAVLDAYGIRKAADVDYIAHSRIRALESQLGWEFHGDVPYARRALAQDLQKLNEHIYLFGLKILSLESLHSYYRQVDDIKKSSDRNLMRPYIAKSTGRKTARQRLYHFKDRGENFLIRKVYNRFNFLRQKIHQRFN